MQNSTNSFTPAKYIKTLSLLHMVIMATPVLVGVFFYSQASDTYLNFTNTEDIFLAICPIVAVGSIFLGDYLLKKMVNSFPPDLDLKEKLIRFQRACIIKYGLMEGATFLCVIFFYQTHNLAYLAIGAFLTFFLFLQRPVKDKIERILNLQGAQKSQFNRMNQPIV